MRLAPRAALALAALLASGCGGPLLTAQLEIPKVGITLPQQQFPASVADPSYWCDPSRPSCIQTELTYDLGSNVSLLSEPGTKYELRLTDLAIQLDATNLATDLHGVQSVQVDVVDPSTGTGVTVASYVRPSPTAAPTEIAVAGNADVDLAPYVQAGQLTARVSMNYDAPTPAFSADVSAAFYLKVDVDYGRQLGL